MMRHEPLPFAVINDYTGRAIARFETRAAARVWAEDRPSQARVVDLREAEGDSAAPLPHVVINDYTGCAIARFESIAAARAWAEDRPSAARVDESSEYATSRFHR